MKEGWEYDKLGNVLKTGAGGTPLKSHKHYYDGGTIPWIRSGEVNNRNITVSELKITQQGLDNSSAKLFPPQTVVIAMYGATAGQVGILGFECATNQAVCGILPNENFIPEFIYYFFLKFKEELIAQAVGNAQPNISQAKIKNTLIPSISLPEQKQIVAILDKAFAAIDQAQANIEKNIENAKELFQSKLNDIFSHPSTSSGQDGDGWEVKTLGKMSKIMYGYTSKVVENGNIQYVRITDIQNGKVDWDTVPFVNISDEEKPKYSLSKGDIVFARTGATTGKSYLMVSPPNSVFASYLIRVQCDKKILEPSFLYLFFQSGIYWRNVEAGISGSAQGGFNASKLGKMMIHFPSNKEKQLEFVAEINEFKSFTKEIESHYQQKLANLEDLKKSILQKAFSGVLTSTGSATTQKPVVV
jgi:type I restriction enzyme S subunit